MYLDLIIFVISLDSRDSPQANYLQCGNFSGGLADSKRLFRCGAHGLVGEYVFIRDNRRDLDYFTLCEVEVFAFRGGSLAFREAAAGGVRWQTWIVRNVGRKVKGTRTFFLCCKSCLSGITVKKSNTQTCQELVRT